MLLIPLFATLLALVTPAIDDLPDNMGVVQIVNKHRHAGFALALDSNLVITTAHQVRNDPETAIVVYSDGTYEVPSLVFLDLSSDIALLRISNAPSSDVLSETYLTRDETEQVYIPARFRFGLEEISNIPIVNAHSSLPFFEPMIEIEHTSFPGLSGTPVFYEDSNHVAGLISRGNPDSPYDIRGNAFLCPADQIRSIVERYGDEEGIPINTLKSDCSKWAKVLDINGNAPDATNPSGATLLTLMCGIRHTPEITQLLEISPQNIIDHQDNRGRTALIYTCLLQPQESVIPEVIVSKLIERGCDINIADSDGRTALYYAVGLRRIEVVRLLLEAGANPAIIDTSTGSLLHVAIWDHNGHTIQPLVNAGTPINATNSRGETPLLTAIRFHYHKCVAMLLDLDADIDIQDNQGNTAAHACAFTGDLEMLDLILSKNPDLSLKNNANLTPLATAILMLSTTRYPQYAVAAIKLATHTAQ